MNTGSSISCGIGLPSHRMNITIGAFDTLELLAVMLCIYVPMNLVPGQTAAVHEHVLAVLAPEGADLLLAHSLDSRSTSLT